MKTRLYEGEGVSGDMLMELGQRVPSFRPWYEPCSGRWVIGQREIHCGDCFMVLARGEAGEQWLHVRAELDQDGWYLVGLPPGQDIRNLDKYEARWGGGSH
jgi:hypothetical protein